MFGSLVNSTVRAYLNRDDDDRAPAALLTPSAALSPFLMLAVNDDGGPPEADAEAVPVGTVPFPLCTLFREMPRSFFGMMYL